MFLDALPVAREIAIIFLVLQWLLLAAVPLFILIKITSGLRQLLTKVRPALRQVHGYERRVLGGVERGLEYVRAPFVWASKTRTSLRSSIDRFSSAWRRQTHG